MAAIYNVIARSGSSGPLIQTLFWEFGFSCDNAITPNVDRIKNAVLVTYGYDLFPHVMTSHFLEIVSDAHSSGNKDIWDGFIVHYSGTEECNKPEDITPESWAKHVYNSMNYIIGRYDLFNGSEESLMRQIEGYNGPKYIIKLEDILNNPETVLSQISDITQEPIPAGLLEYHKKSVANQQLRLAPYLEAYQKIA